MRRAMTMIVLRATGANAGRTLVEALFGSRAQRAVREQRSALTVYNVRIAELIEAAFGVAIAFIAPLGVRRALVQLFNLNNVD